MLALLEPLELLLQDGARRMRHRLVVMMVEHVAEDERGAVEPRRPAQRREIGLHDEVAIALLPARRLVAGHRLHIDVVGEQIVAAMRLLIGAVDEELGLEALADQPPLHVGEGRDAPYRSRRLATSSLSCVKRQIAGHDETPVD